MTDGLKWAKDLQTQQSSIFSGTQQTQYKILLAKRNYRAKMAVILTLKSWQLFRVVLHKWVFQTSTRVVLVRVETSMSATGNGWLMDGL